jgi:hypothetical protein
MLASRQAVAPLQRQQLGPTSTRWQDQSSAVELIRLGRASDDQIVWCSLGEQPLYKEDIGKNLHAIDVVETDVVAVVDTLIWCHIIGYAPNYILNDDDERLRYESEVTGRPLEDLREAFLSNRLPNDLWSGVVKEESNSESDQVLLRFPLDGSDISVVQNIDAAMVKQSEKTAAQKRSLLLSKIRRHSAFQDRV